MNTYLYAGFKSLKHNLKFLIITSSSALKPRGSEIDLILSPDTASFLLM